VEALLSKFQQWEEVERQRVAKHGEKGKGKNYARRLMALCVRLLLASGMRPGKEVLELTWADIQAGAPVERTGDHLHQPVRSWEDRQASDHL
jgi:integrase